MPQSPLRLIKRCAEFLPKEGIDQLPGGLRGIYVLYRRDAKRQSYGVMYVGMARARAGRVGIRRRLASHAKSRRKRKLWTHFSVFEVWDNVRDEEIVELEGLFRHIYRKDSIANSLNLQRGYKSLRKVRNNKLEKWV